MKGLRSWLICWLILFPAPAVAAHSQRAQRSNPATPPVATSASAGAATARYLKQPYVIEKYTTSVQFEDDGSQTRSVSARIRIQSTVAAEKFSQLDFAYDSSTAELGFRRVRVLKPDGRYLNTSLDAVKEEPAAVTRDAPAYAGYREKSIWIPRLQPGDTLEYEIVTRLTHPQAAGEFWMQHSFLSDAIVLREDMEVDIPKSRKLDLKSPRFPYAKDVTALNNRIVYRWRHANLALSPEDGEVQSATQQVRWKPADVELTTFASWDDVSRWYGKLQRGEQQPTAEIRATAAELTDSRATDIEKTEAVYDYVSKKIRTVNLPFGAAGYQPRPAAQVLAGQYGTDADKQVLLASLLDAAGLHSATALIADSRILNESLPSPAQFGHALTVVLLDNRRIWLDTTTAVAAFQFLPPSMRKKSALLISSDGTGKIVETPADPPFLSTQRVETQGRVSDLGKLTAHIHYQLRGDNEFVLRLAFRRTPETQWKELAQEILARDGVHGEVTSVNPGDPTDTEAPFAIDIEYSQSNFLDGTNTQARLAMPLLTIGMPEPPNKTSSEDFELGNPLQVTTQLKLTFPERFTARAPVAVAVSRDYAQFKSSYSFDNHTLLAGRSLDFKIRTVPGSRIDDYLAFSHAVAADQGQSLLVENSAAGPSGIPSDATADELFEAGAATLGAGKVHSSIPLFEHLVELDPTYKEAWNELGLSYMRDGQLDRAAYAFRKQLEANPSDPQAHNYLGLVLEQQQKYEEAALAFRKQTELNPLDTVAHAALGTIYLSQHEYAQGAPELDKAAVLSPDKAELQLSLGQAYAGLGQNEKALAAFEKAVALSPVPAVWNSVARSLAEHKLEPAKAQKYAESAVSSAAARIQGIDAAHVSADQYSEESTLANYWDTLGWVYFQKGDVDAAKRYIHAAWLSDQRGEIAGHLARVQEKVGQKDQAIHWYALALAAPDADPEARARLTLLLGGNSRIEDLVEQCRHLLTSVRTIADRKLLDRAAKAEFVVALSPKANPPHGSRIIDIRFVGGSEELRPLADRLRSIDFGPMFPDNSLTKLARRGAITCPATTGECSFALLPLEIVQPAK